MANQLEQKIEKDLEQLVEKMDLCDTMLRPPGSVRDDAARQVIGFLEACAPRIVGLVEAGSQGLLNETLLVRCLDLNDRLTKQLQQIDTLALTETPASTSVASAPPTSQINALRLDESESSSKETQTPAALGTKSTGEDDPFAVFGSETDSKPPAEPVASSPNTQQADPFAVFDDKSAAEAGDQATSNAIQSTPSNDEFDSFFEERQTGTVPVPDT